MNGREKLIELIKAGGKLAVEENHKYIQEFVKNHGRYNSKTDNNVPFEEIVADYLLANGVILVDTNCVKRENLPLIQQAFNMPLDELAKIVEKHTAQNGLAYATPNFELLEG